MVRQGWNSRGTPKAASDVIRAVTLMTRLAAFIDCRYGLPGIAIEMVLASQTAVECSRCRSSTVAGSSAHYNCTTKSPVPSLHLARLLRMEVHKVLRLPRNLRMEVHKVLRLPEICPWRFSRFIKCCACHKICAWRFTKCCACHEICVSRFTKRCACHDTRRSQSAVPATKSAHGGSQSAVPATKSALQETSENSNHNGGTIRT